MSSAVRKASALDQQRLRERMALELPPGLLAHIDRVVTLAAELARLHDTDVTRTLLAAQGHDLLRASAPAELLAGAEARGLEIDPVERAAPVLLHGPLGALELRERFAVEDESVLHAVRWHTTGHPHYDTEAWAFFIADKAEPEKVRAWPALRRVLDRALEASSDALEQAALAYLTLSIERGAREGWTPHPLSLRTREALRERLRER